MLHTVQSIRVMGQRRRLTALMRSIAHRLVIAASRDGLVRMDWRANSEDMLARLERGEGGVWCADAALILWRAFVERGYTASVVSFGFFPRATHAGVLVRIGKAHYYYDPYFDFELERSFEDAIADYVRTGSLELRSGPATPRPCYLTYAMDDDTHWWDYNGPRPTTFPATCSAYFTVDRFAASPPNRWGWDGLENFGLAPRIQSLFLFPFAVLNQDHLYSDDPMVSPLLSYLISVTRCRGAAQQDEQGACDARGWHRSLLMDGPASDGE